MHADPAALTAFPHRSRTLVPVPWDKAGSIRNRLAERGVMAVACYDPEERRAVLELSQDIDLQSIEDIVRGKPA